MTLRQAILAAGALLLAPAAHAAGVSASTALTDEEGVRHDAEAAFDGLLTTSWCEGDTGVGEGSWIELRFDRPTAVSSLSIWPGDLSNGARSLKERGRPRVIQLSVDGGEPQEIALRDGAEQGEQRVDVALQGEARVLRLTMATAMAGWLHNDTCVAEVAVNLLAGDRGSAAKLDAWIASPAGQKAIDAHHLAVIERFDKITASDFGDRDALHELMDWAAGGPPYLRERVKREIAPGFRVAALPPDTEALDALGKVKDANAIPAFTLAALRRTGDEQRRLLAKASYLAALTELGTGGRRSVPVWGVEGWEKGAIRSFGEPTGIARSSDGRLYVADLANHRVDVFDPAGRVLATWGKGDPVVTDAWYGGRRKHYVAGRQPGKDEGAFTNPLAVALREGKEGVSAMVLDATGRVQVFDEDGKVTATWTLPVELPAAPGIGGSGHLLVTKKGVVAIVGNEAFTLDAKGEVVASWKVQEGSPITAAVLKSGHLGLGFASSAVEYDASGFRIGALLSADDLPLGVEGWSLATDEKGKLWLVTDNGWVRGFKRPGMIEHEVRWSEVGGRAPRFAVDDGILWIVADGTIQKVDALEVEAEAAAAEADAE